MASLETLLNLDTVSTHAWEKWTDNGYGMDADEMEQTMKSVRDAATNAYIYGMSETEWMAATLRRLNGEGV